MNFIHNALLIHYWTVMSRKMPEMTFFDKKAINVAFLKKDQLPGISRKNTQMHIKPLFFIENSIFFIIGLDTIRLSSHA